MAVKLAPSYTENPEGWFSQVEAQFGIRSVPADDAHFWYVCTGLDAETFSKVTRAVCNIETGKKYEAVTSYFITFHPVMGKGTENSQCKGIRARKAFSAG